ncbi:uncharacterized protein LOC121997620 isoform X2 [Zingiber officinale]|uniref:uncharacterized protein LOC121997620 isoform X2 n=1 Tax=Zingiber officinale TaxID=94328 RepID=UPI001C4A7F59|nr:uncharacterized protein LOC121997620 isoform X2 [Zingiber officinale]
MGDWEEKDWAHRIQFLFGVKIVQIIIAGGGRHSAAPTDDGEISIVELASCMNGEEESMEGSGLGMIRAAKWFLRKSQLLVGTNIVQVSC